MLKLRLLQLLILVAVLTCGFVAGYTWPRGEVREVVSYIEDCSLSDAHAGKCAIPCGSEKDCVEKNGTRDAY